MSNFARVIHHIDMKDVKRKRLEKIAAEKLKEERDKREKKLIKEISRKYKSDWKTELSEKMTTGAVFTTTIAPAEGDGTVAPVDPIDAASFSDTTNMFGADGDNSALDGATIRANGSGSGSTGGFDVGGNYLAFQGTGSGGSRMALLKPMDATRLDTLTITAIRGTGSNGGEHPDIIGQEELFVIYKTPDMSRSSYLSQDRSQNNVGSFPDDAAIIAINQGDGTLQDYTIKIPEYARQKDTIFGLFQLGHSGSNYDHYGVTDIKFQRKTPLNVVVPLDDPQAVSFIRVGTDEGDPKKRKKKLNDQLAASDEYTTNIIGAPFPGAGTRVGGDDPYRSATVTSDDEIEASPIGRDEVKKSFSKFSADSAVDDTDADTTQVVITPSTQTTMNPTNDEGEEIPVKTVGGKNSGIVQGADAANLDAQNAQDDAQDTTTTSDPEEPEIPDPEEIKPDPEETKDKTPDEQTQLEIDKKQGIFDSALSKLENQLNNTAKTASGFLNIIDIVLGPVQAVLNLAGSISSLTSRITGKDKPQWMQVKDDIFGKLNNNISIARSQLTGKVKNGNLNMYEYDEFVSNISVGTFTHGSPNSNLSISGTGALIPISSQRHEYQDDNIYVMNGKIYNNREEKATTLTAGHNGLEHHGEGYGQMIIPPDGGEPYVHYYDYGYNNLNNPDDIGTDNDLAYAITSFLSDVSLFLSSVPGVGGTLVDAFNTDKWMDGLRNTSSMEGWPPGIHGAVLIDFKVPLSRLNAEVQEMIALHPLSWTDERVANMSDQDLSQQFDKLLSKEGVPTVLNTEEDVDKYMEGLIEIMNSRDIDIDPEFKESFIGSMGIYDEMDEVEVKRQEVVDSEEYFLAFDKAYEDWESLLKEKEDAISDENLMKEVPDPKGEYPKFDMKNDPKIVELNKQYDEACKAYDDYYNNEYNSAWGLYKSHADTLEEKDGILYGTDEEIAKLKLLGKKVTSSRNELDRLSSKYDSVIEQQKQASTDYLNKITKQREPWTKAREKREARREELSKQYDELIDEVYIKFEDTFMVREGQDGKLLNGGDYTDLSGKTYAGKETLTDPFDLEMEELEKKSEQYLETLNKFGFRYMYGTISQYLVNKQFTDTVIDWTPAKKGTGNIPGGYRSSGAGSNQGIPGYGSGYSISDPIVGAGGRRDRRGKRGTAFEELSLFERVKQKPFFNPKDIKPVFPENPPPQLDPKTGMHPEYGKTAKRYRKLDPISANAMPPTGDPETDAVVDKQRTKPKPKLFNKLKKHSRKGLTDK